jgi:integrase
LLWEVGGAFEKALLATACSQGWEISMFLEQKRDKVERRIAHADQNGVQFVFFMDAREKTGEPRLCVLNPLAVECLKKYLAVRVDDDARLFPITADGVQKMLYRLAKDANLKTTGSLRFHNIRKWLMSRLSRCNFNEFQIKFVMGKSIGISDGVYLQTLQSEIEEKYPVVYNDYLNICWKPGVSSVQVFSLEEVKRLKAMLAAFESGEIEFKR